jgi:hypothetical protein
VQGIFRFLRALGFPSCFVGTCAPMQCQQPSGCISGQGRELLSEINQKPFIFHRASLLGHISAPSEMTPLSPAVCCIAIAYTLSLTAVYVGGTLATVQMVSEPWAPGLCVLVFWCRDAGPSLAENVTYSEMDYTLDEENAAAAYSIMTMTKTTVHSIILETRWRSSVSRQRRPKWWLAQCCLTAGMVNWWHALLLYCKNTVVWKWK